LLSRFNIATAFMLLSSIRSEPRQGHLERSKHVWSYLRKMKHAVLCFRTGEPDLSDLPDNEYDCDNTAYGRVHKEIPDDKHELLICSII